MSFPKTLHDTFTAAEVLFLTENSTTKVTSNVTMSDKLPLITTDLPKLRLMSTYEIPIWLAIILRKQNKITVVPPQWLTESYLTNMYQEEIQNPGVFSKLPPNWLEMSKVFLTHFRNDLIDSPDSLLQVLQDLKEIRLVKLRKGLNNLNEVNLGLNDLSLMEINEFRPFISKVMGTLSRLQRAVEDDEPVEHELDEPEDLDLEINGNLDYGTAADQRTELDNDEDDTTMGGIIDEFRL